MIVSKKLINDLQNNPSKVGLGIKIKEVPIDYYGRTHAQGKKIVFLDGIKAIYSIFKYNLFKNN